jgi:uncharacterized protein (DUF2141 family)
MMISFKKLTLGGLAALSVATMTTPAAATLGPHAARCDNGETSVVVNVTGLRDRNGTMRVQIWRADDNYLRRRQWFQRVEVPVTRSGDMPICVPVTGPGRYVVSVRHDSNGNGSSDRSDGAGFSGNPPVSLLDAVLGRRPALNRVAFTVGTGPARQSVTLNYVQGTRVGPVRS